MPRVARIVVADCPHHVTQKGNSGQDIFFSDDDRRVFLGLLSRYARECAVAIEGYCLMTNHVHLIATPATEKSLARAMGRLNFRYAQYVNRVHGRTGHLWQNRFFSCALDDAHFWAALLYVEQNPSRAGIAPVSPQYPWSSAGVHCATTVGSGLLDLRRWRRMANEAEWEKALASAQASEEADLVRHHTKTGRPLGTAGFIAKIESALGRRAHAFPEGRPRKKSSAHQN
jgi:putative transposase